MQKIATELQENIDNHSQILIVSNIEIFLNYCSCYYGRQFIAIKSSNSNTIALVKKLLKSYFKSEQLKETVLPTLKYLADNVHLSASYLSDLLKKETGMSAQYHIH